MSKTGYSEEQLYKIAHDNYRILKKFCDLLCMEGYWETAERVLDMSAEQILDIYVESLLVCFSDFCNILNDTEKHYIAALSDNIKKIITDEKDQKKLLSNAARFQRTPPILFQLLSLRDIEKNSGTAALFFDAIVNLMLSLIYHAKDEAHVATATKYLGIYFDKVGTFLTNNKNPKQSVDSKYIFKKLCRGELLNSAKEIEEADCDFEAYKIKHLFYSPDQLKPVASVTVSKYAERDENGILKDTIDPAEEIGKNTYETGNSDLKDLNSSEKRDKAENENQKEQVLLKAVHDSKLDEVLSELNSLVGMEEVKKEIESLINLIKVRKMRDEFKLPQPEISYHMVFTGNPGTGKTTVARIVARVYKELGILSKGTLTETDRSGLVAGYVGQTALKVKEVVEKSLGGVLFIDEAYALVSESANDFGKEALDTLVKLMEDNRNDLVVIACGYTKEMKNFLKSNSGLVSRFNRFIEFPDYSDEELTEIMEKTAKKNGFVLEDGIKEKLLDYLKNMPENKKYDFGNARGIRNLFESMMVNQANRVVKSEVCSMEQLTELKQEDISW